MFCVKVRKLPRALSRYICVCCIMWKPLPTSHHALTKWPCQNRVIFSWNGRALVTMLLIQNEQAATYWSQLLLVSSLWKYAGSAGEPFSGDVDDVVDGCGIRREVERLQFGESARTNYELRSPQQVGEVVVGYGHADAPSQLPQSIS